MRDGLSRKSIVPVVLAALLLVLATLACGEEASPTQDEPTAEASALTVETSPTAESTIKAAPTDTTQALVPTVDTSNCVLGATFGADVTVSDNTTIEGGQPFVKTWRVRNTGACDWGPGYRWTFVDGEQMGGPDSVAVPETPSGESAEISVELVAPQESGQHRGYWRMCVNEEQCFGDRVYVQIISTGVPTPEPQLIRSLSEFEGSQFCIVYGCRFDDSWNLQRGGTDNVYDIDMSPEVGIEVVTLNGIPVDFGLTFYYRERLTAEDLQLIYLFLSSIHSGVEVDSSTRDFIAQNAEIDVFQICEARSVSFGSMHIWAGRIFEQTVHIGADCP